MSARALIFFEHQRTYNPRTILKSLVWALPWSACALLKLLIDNEDVLDNEFFLLGDTM
jgi:hypothetical protein